MILLRCCQARLKPERTAAWIRAVSEATSLSTRSKITRGLEFHFRLVEVAKSAAVNATIGKHAFERDQLTSAILASLFAQLLLCQFSWASRRIDTRTARPPEYTFKIVRTFPHDSNAFTQGLGIP